MATPILFDFDNPADAQRSIKKVSQLLQRAGQPVVSAEFDAKIKRIQGIAAGYREASFTLASGQIVTLRVKDSGDVYQVLLNGSVKPLKNHDDPIKAVGEIATMAEANQAKFQAALARKKVDMPAGIKTAAPKMEAALQARVTELQGQIAEKQKEVEALTAELGQTLDGAGMAQKVDQIADHTAELTEAATAQAALDGAGLVQKTEQVGDHTAVQAAANSSQAVMDSATFDAAGFPMKWYDGLYYARDQFTLEPTDEHGEMPPSWVLRSDAVAVGGPSLDDATLDAAKKNNQKGYVVYVVAGGKIESGWEYEDDAKEHKAENMPDKLKSGAKVVKKAGLKKFGLDPDDNASWLTASALDSAQETDAVAQADAVLIGLEVGKVLDAVGMGHALAALQIALSVAETNHPINLAAGNAEQAELEENAAASYRLALATLDDAADEVSGDENLGDEHKPLLDSATELSGAEVDVLKALADRGPLEDGDIPSKEGRDGLVERGFAERDDNDLNVITKAGVDALSAITPAE